MDIVSTQQKQKMHPHKFTMWVAIGSIIMMFAGLTSAYIVKSNQTNWITVELPKAFWVSTAVILISSLTLQMALRSFKQRQDENVFVGGVVFAFYFVLVDYNSRAVQ